MFEFDSSKYVVTIQSPRAYLSFDARRAAADPSYSINHLALADAVLGSGIKD